MSYSARQLARVFVALAAVLLMFGGTGYAKTDKRWAISMVLGVATAIADFFVHPGMFGPVALEAIITGIGAGALSYLVGTLIHRARK